MLFIIHLAFRLQKHGILTKNLAFLIRHLQNFNMVGKNVLLYYYCSINLKTIGNNLKIQNFMKNPHSLDSSCICLHFKRGKGRTLYNNLASGPKVILKLNLTSDKSKMKIRIQKCKNLKLIVFHCQNQQH